MAAPTEFIKAPEGAVQTLPVTAENRIPDSDISIELCTEEDALQIASGFYTVFPPEWWAPKEPPHLRPPPPIRLSRLATRLLPTFSHPGLHWLKATHLPTTTLIGAACWASPTLPCHNVLRRSAPTFYGWQAKMGWTNAEMAEMWAGVDDEKWSGQFERDDEVREALTGGPHWYLAPLMVWPEWQGRGVGRRLLDWALKRAEEEGGTVFLESRPNARAVYLHCGFEPYDEYRFMKRGRGVVKEGGEEEVGGEQVEG